MIEKRTTYGRWGLSCLGCLGCLGCLAFAAVASAQPAAEPGAQVLTLDAAVRWALVNSPELAAIRQQHGIAAAAVVIADTYPYNPVLDSKLRSASGPTSATPTNQLSQEHKLLLDIEVRGQGRYRRAGAAAALSRTDWEIAAQEVALAVRVERAFGTVLYYQEKMRLADEAVQLSERTVADVRALVRAGAKLGPADEILATTDVDDTRAQLGPGRANFIKAWHELRRALGLLEEPLEVEGVLDPLTYQGDLRNLIQGALTQRADLRARRLAVAEAEARLRLAVADRFGNPNLGPDIEYDPARVIIAGVQVTLPLPVFNTRRGEIQQREAERDRAVLELKQYEVQAQEEVQAALARLKQARTSLDVYQTKVLPNLQSSLKNIEQLFTSNQGVDVLRVIDVRRKLLRARDGYLDALWEVNQAQADLAAAVGDPALAVAPCSAP